MDMTSDEYCLFLGFLFALVFWVYGLVKKDIYKYYFEYGVKTASVILYVIFLVFIIFATIQTKNLPIYTKPLLFEKIYECLRMLMYTIILAPALIYIYIFICAVFFAIPFFALTFPIVLDNESKKETAKEPIVHKSITYNRNNEIKKPVVTSTPIVTPVNKVKVEVVKVSHEFYAIRCPNCHAFINTGLICDHCATVVRKS